MVVFVDMIIKAVRYFKWKQNFQMVGIQISNVGQSSFVKEWEAHFPPTKHHGLL